MKNKILIIGCMLLLVLSGCIDNSVEGTYESEDGRHTIHLFDDFRFHLEDSRGRSACGTWKVEGDIIYLFGENNIVREGMVGNSYLIDDEGQKWNKI